MLHLGDYLYEYAPGEYQARDVVRPHEPAVEMTRLAHYRRRHAQYKTDADLQALHAAAPFIVTWDDHESANDAWKDGAENHTEGAEGTWRERSAAAQQAYAEWMPVPCGQLYRRLDFGSLASLSMLDLRSYRDQHAANVADPSISSTDRTITGAAQMDWLLGNLDSGGPQWRLVGNPVMIAPVRVPSTLSTAELGGVQQLMGGTRPKLASQVGVASLAGMADLGISTRSVPPGRSSGTGWPLRRSLGLSARPQGRD